MLAYNLVLMRSFANSVWKVNFFCELFRFLTSKLNFKHLVIHNTLLLLKLVILHVIEYIICFNYNETTTAW